METRKVADWLQILGNVGVFISADVGAYAESIGALLLVPIISMAVYFRMQPKEISNE